jgi:transposase
LKTQVLIHQQTQQILALEVGLGRQHDFALCRATLPVLPPTTVLLADSGYQGLAALQKADAVMIPFKSRKKQPLSDEQKEYNRQLSRQRIVIEHVFARLKVFKILAHRYRNRRQCFEIRAKLIAALCNLQRSHHF